MGNSDCKKKAPDFDQRLFYYDDQRFYFTIILRVAFWLPAVTV